ncbi:uncharacterized protein CIMG_05449 [Coccidioides immitis RS]|uniref:PPPDE domain-containing protein n=1 Tax=Coccidioides immitis (strain RS) TaxID=246410 RepID=J3KFL3_COCIM|nr:uncharacterized protein CIMG_05449 [Coccidioides immitis RS]EAS34425.3 hypothetical protein CIMG_05449 [Coccidioides immitis RS]
MSSSLSASSQTVEHAPQTLHLVAFGTRDRAHLALFIPNRMADPTGTLVHIRIRGNDPKSGGGEAELLVNQFQLSHSSAKSIVPLTGSCASREEVEDVAKECFKNFAYNIVLDNCQTFTSDVLTELHIRFPSQIQQASIDLIQNSMEQHQSKSSNSSTETDKKKVPKQVNLSPQSHGSHLIKSNTFSPMNVRRKNGLS